MKNRKCGIRTLNNCELLGVTGKCISRQASTDNKNFRDVSRLKWLYLEIILNHPLYIEFSINSTFQVNTIKDISTI